MKAHGYMENTELIELYQLLRMFLSVYPEDERISGVMAKVRHEYSRINNGADIDNARNPRGAGRKRTYTKEEDDAIMKLYRETKSMRKVANEYGCSLGHVQDVISRSV